MKAKYPTNPKVKVHSRVILNGSNGTRGTVIKLDRYPYGAKRAYVLWDGYEIDWGMGPGILTYRTTSLTVVG